MASTARNGERISVPIRATVEYMGRESNASIVDMSPNGMCLYVYEDLAPITGHNVRVTTKEMGVLDGNVRWSLHPRVGISLDLSPENKAVVEMVRQQFT